MKKFHEIEWAKLIYTLWMALIYLFAVLTIYQFVTAADGTSLEKGEASYYLIMGVVLFYISRSFANHFANCFIDKPEPVVSEIIIKDKEGPVRRHAPPKSSNNYDKSWP